MRFGIIGAGKIGSTLARRLTALGHEVSIDNSRGPETLAALARETGAKPVTVEEAARAGDVVIVSLPVKHISHLPAGLFEGVAKDVVVVDREPVGCRPARPADWMSPGDSSPADGQPWRRFGCLRP
jgi:predicted dinucleotide-binding enzyme